MARIRTIKPEFFRHEVLFEAEKNTGLPLRVAYAGLFTAADREGRFKWSPRTLKLDCLPYDEVDFAAVLDALVAAGFIVKYQIDGESYGAILSWSAHQHVNVREKPSDIPAPEVGRCTHPPRQVCARGEGKGREGEGTERKATDGNGAEQGTDKRTDNGANLSTLASASPARDDFDAFWKLYPRRKGSNPKAPAEKAFHGAVRSGVAASALVCAVKNFAAAEAAKADTEFIPMALTWLKQRRFEEYGPDPGLIEKLRAQAPMMRERGYELDEANLAWRKMEAAA
jgi:hypothetical protein